MDQRIANARHIYERGIRDGDIDDGLSVLGDRYTQHSQGVPDGPDGFRAFFEDFLQRHPVRDIELVRVLADEDGVFVHARQDLDDGGDQWVTFDWFAFDDRDRIVEHWDVIAPWTAHGPGGRTSTDGPTEVVDVDRAGDNRAVVHRALAQLRMADGDVDAGLELVAEDHRQHDADVPDGRAALAALLQGRDAPVRYHRIVRTTAMGEFVATLSEASRDGAPYAHADLFRLEGGLIVEHWGASEAIGPPETWNNGGKF